MTTPLTHDASTASAEPLGLPELADVLTSVIDQIRTLYAQALTIVAEMNRDSILRASGYSTLPKLLSDLIRVTPQRASRMITQARLVTQTAAKPLDEPPTGKTLRTALRDGALDADHIATIAEIVAKIPPETPEHTVRLVEHALVRTAETGHAGDVRRHGKALLAQIDPGQNEPGNTEPTPPHNLFQYQRTTNGRMILTGNIEPDAADKLDSLLTTLAHPDKRPRPQILGDAFTELIHGATCVPSLTRGKTKPRPAPHARPVTRHAVHQDRRSAQRVSTCGAAYRTQDNPIAVSNNPHDRLNQLIRDPQWHVRTFHWNGELTPYPETEIDHACT